MSIDFNRIITAIGGLDLDFAWGQVASSLTGKLDRGSLHLTDKELDVYRYAMRSIYGPEEEVAAGRLFRLLRGVPQEDILRLYSEILEDKESMEGLQIEY